MPRAPVMALAAILMLIVPLRPARPALESPAGDPLAMGHAGYGPAWPEPRPVVDGPLLFHRPARAGLSLFTVRWSAIPEVRRQGGAAWVPIRSSLVSARLRRLSIEGYSEYEAGLEWARPSLSSRPVGWSIGWSRAGWRVGGGSGRVDRFSGAIGCRLKSAARLALRLADESGGRSITPPLIQLGLVVDVVRDWQAGLHLERLGDRPWVTRAGLRARCCGGVAIVAGLEPGSGAAAIGLSLRRAPIGLEVARLDHPRLGALTSTGFTVGGGDAP